MKLLKWIHNKLDRRMKIHKELNTFIWNIDIGKPKFMDQVEKTDGTEVRRLSAGRHNI